MNQRDQTHTEVEARISLTAEEMSKYRRLSRFDYQFDSRLSSLVLDLLEERAVRQDEMWKSVAEHTTYGSLDKVLEADRRVVLHWITGELVVYKRPEDKEKSCAEPSK